MRKGARLFPECLAKGEDMSDSTTVKLPKAMPLAKRIEEASKQISEWLENLDSPYNDEKDRLQLTKMESNAGEYCYHYSIIKRRDLSVSDVSIRKR